MIAIPGKIAQAREKAEQERELKAWLLKHRKAVDETGLDNRERQRIAILLNQLTLKFGEPSASTRERVSKATVDELDAFAARVLGAQSLRDVFDPAPASRAGAARSPRTTSKTRKKKR